MNALQRLLDEGQSVWYDFISRDFIASGQMQRLVDAGLRGMTSNPTIFERAIAGGGDYDQQIRWLAAGGASAAEIGTGLFVTDIRNACDVMLPVHEASGGGDGFISLEVNPKIAEDTQATLAEARQLWRLVDRPNLMIKIPATPEGLPAVRAAIAEEISVNITLMFSMAQYRAVAGAYIAGLEDRLAAGHPVGSINSVASVFISRIDSMIDGILDKIGTPEALALRGKAGLANSKLIYQAFGEIFSGERWERLASAGARMQRPLWASTSIKNPNYPALLYVVNLVGPHTVNTLPPETLETLMGGEDKIRRTIDQDTDKAEGTMNALRSIGVDVDGVMSALLDEGVEKFEKSFDTLMSAIETKRAALLAESRDKAGLVPTNDTNDEVGSAGMAKGGFA